MFAAKAKPRKTIARRRKKQVEITSPLVEELSSGKKSEDRESGAASTEPSHVSMVEASGIMPETSGSSHLPHPEVSTSSTTKVIP